MDTSEFHGLAAPTPERGLAAPARGLAAPDFDRLANLMQQHSGVLREFTLSPAVQESLRSVGRAAAEAAEVHVNLAPALSGITAAMDRMIQQTSLAPALAQHSAAILQASRVTEAIADTVDLSWLSENLSRVMDAAVRTDWFEDQVLNLYASGLLDDLDELASTDTGHETPATVAALELEDSVPAFQEQVAYLAFAEQKKLFVSFACAIALSLAAVLVVAVQDDGKAGDVLGAAGDITGIVATAGPAAIMAWDRRSRRRPDHESEGEGGRG